MEKGYKVEIIAEVIPTDPKTIKYTSHWAVSLYLLIVYIFYNYTVNADCTNHYVGCSSCQYRRDWNISSRFVILVWFSRIASFPILSVKEIDRETFWEMWDLSRPGGEAEECFLRVDQTEFYEKRIPRPNPIETMPNVSSLSC